MSLLLIPATKENLEKSIDKSVDLSFAAKYLPNEFLSEITKYSGIEGIRCWALTKNNISLYNQIQNGDEVLLTQKGTGEFTHYGVIIGKIQNADFGNALWPFITDNPWEYIYFLANITKVQIDKTALVRELGYSDNFTVPGSIKVKDDYYNKIGSISKKFEVPVFDNVAEVNEDKDFSADNIQSLGKRRVGQNKFSKDIKKAYNYKCSICGISEPEFLVAGHISTWSEDKENRLNPQNGICLCSLHDKAFEHGYIGLNDTFELIINTRISKESILHKQLKPFDGHKIDLPQNNKPYLDFLKSHRQKHKLGEYGD